MNELRLKEYTADHVIYLYLPEGKGEFGEVIYYAATDEATVSKRASGDEVGRYGHNAARKVKEIMKERSLPKNFIQAWY